LSSLKKLSHQKKALIKTLAPIFSSQKENFQNGKEKKNLKIVYEEKE